MRYRGLPRSEYLVLNPVSHPMVFLICLLTNVLKCVAVFPQSPPFSHLYKCVLLLDLKGRRMPWIFFTSVEGRLIASLSAQIESSQWVLCLLKPPRALQGKMYINAKYGSTSSFLCSSQSFSNTYVVNNWYASEGIQQPTSNAARTL